MAEKLTITEVNNLTNEEFEAVFGNVIELCADAAKSVKNLRPFMSVGETCSAFCGYLEEIGYEGELVHYDRGWVQLAQAGLRYIAGPVSRSLISDADVTPEEDGSLPSTEIQRDICVKKLTILKLHPDLAGRLAAQGDLTKESTNEQRSAGLHEITADDKKIIDERNERYKQKFGFPFVICARKNKVQSILAGLESRYHNTQEQEIITGIEEVKKICTLRIHDIIKE